jgi:cold shock protein
MRETRGVSRGSENWPTREEKALCTGVGPAGDGAAEVKGTGSTVSVPRSVPRGSNTPTLHRIKEGTESEEGSMPVGVVKWFNDQRGYGFITPDEGERDVFVHSSGVQGTGQGSLREGQRVEFEVIQGEKGPQASNVRPVG